ncbi:hypothetical protein [Prosthecobacter fluviatilis]
MLLLLTCCLMNVAAEAGEVMTQRVASNEKYTAVTMSDPSLNLASWFVPNELGRYDKGFTKAADLIEHFRRQPAERTDMGIFVVSYTHSVVLNEESKKRMSSHLLRLLDYKPWREAENELVQELVDAANREGIPVWINFTNDMRGPYPNKLLTDPKRTLKK